MFRLNDDKDLKRTLPTGTTTNAVDDYAETIEQSFPHCLIIFINQPGLHYVAIEKKQVRSMENRQDNQDFKAELRSYDQASWLYGQL